MKAAASFVPGFADALANDQRPHLPPVTAERQLLDDLAAYVEETRGYIEDREAGSGYFARQLSELLARHRAIKAGR